MKSKISRREFLKIAGASMVGLALAGRNWENLSVARLPASPANSPNILLISIDALRADRLSVAGYHRPTSPNLDRLAGQGVMFENAYST